MDFNFSKTIRCLDSPKQQQPNNGREYSFVLKKLKNLGVANLVFIQINM